MSGKNLAGTTYTGYKSENGSVVPYSATIPELGPHDVLVRITHTGVCASDAVYVSLGAPVALGHEGVGIVEAVGSSVHKFKPGDRAGGGFHRDACGHCRHCLEGRDIYCHDRVILGEGDFANGTFGQYYIGKEGFLHSIPDGLSSEDAAPLQCAGVTVYTALRDTVRPGMRVGIYGIGGLGHLAIQFAAKMGCEVVVYSTSAAKEAEARGWGASEFHLVSDMFETTKAPIQVLVIAGSHYPDFQRAMTKEFLGRRGVIVPLTAPHGQMELNMFNLFFDGYQIYTSLVGSRRAHEETLEFAARHGIKPVIELGKLEDASSIQNVFDNLAANKVRYRAVLEV